MRRLCRQRGAEDFRRHGGDSSLPAEAVVAGDNQRQVGYLLSRKAFADFKKRLDYSEYGGAPLLGIKGVCIVSHGSSNSNAIKNAVRVAMEFANSRLNSTIEERIAAASRGLTHSAPEPAEADSIGSGLV